MTGSLYALAAAGTANVGALAAAATGTASDVAPWVQGGGSAAAVAGLVYVARLIAKGELVPRAVKDTENELSATIMVSAQREAATMRIAEESIEARKREGERHDRALVLITEVRRSLTDVAAEMEYWREMRDRGTRREDRGPDHRSRP